MQHQNQRLKMPRDTLGISRRHTAKLRKSGCCIECGKNVPASESRFQLNLGEKQWMCLKCNQKRCTQAKEKYRKSIEIGLCGQCGKRPLVTKSVCEPCRILANVRHQKIAAYLISVGRCTGCRKLNDGPFRKCSMCRWREKFNKQKRRRAE